MTYHSRPRCAVCGEPGHKALACPYRRHERNKVGWRPERKETKQQAASAAGLQSGGSRARR